MARIRTIKPEFWSDEKLSTFDPVTRLVFLGLISQADDAGRLVDNVKLLDGLLFPETDDSCRAALDTLAAHSRVVRYTSASGQRLIQIANWDRHQRVDRPSKHNLPGPDDPGSEVAYPQHDTEPQRGTRDTLATPSRDSIAPTVYHVPSTGDLTTTGDKSPEAPPHDLHPVENPDLEAEQADAPPPEQPDPKVVPLRKAESTLNDHRGQAVTLILERLWLNTRDSPPRRFGRDWSIANELSIWNALVKHESPEEVNGAIGHMRRVGEFGDSEPLSLKLFHSKDPNSRTLYAACLQAHRRELERDAGRFQRQLGGIVDQVMARANVSA
jgi:hypothetical protein